MASSSLNQEFDKLVKVTLAEKQQISDNSNNSNNSNENEKKPDMTDRSAKASISFRITSCQMKDLKGNTPQHVSNREIFSRIYLMLG